MKREREKETKDNKEEEERKKERQTDRQKMKKEIRKKDRKMTEGKKEHWTELFLLFFSRVRCIVFTPFLSGPRTSVSP